MIPNQPDYKTINVSSEFSSGISLKTTYETPKYSFFNFLLNNSNIQRFPIVCKINKTSEAYKLGLRIGHSIIKINEHSFEYKDIDTILSDFLYEKKISNSLKIRFF